MLLDGDDEIDRSVVLLLLLCVCMRVHWEEMSGTMLGYSDTMNDKQGCVCVSIIVSAIFRMKVLFICLSAASYCVCVW